LIPKRKREREKENRDVLALVSIRKEKLNTIISDPTGDIDVVRLRKGLI